jgi:hypothetical protein
MLPLLSTETGARNASTGHHHFKMSGGNAELADGRFSCENPSISPTVKIS